MRQIHYSMKPQDVVILLKILTKNNHSSDGENWHQLPLAKSLKISQSELSQSVGRSKYAGLLDTSGKMVMRQTLMDFLQYGIAVVFPTKPGPMVRGLPTAHSVAPLNKQITSVEQYVWPYGKGKQRGQGISPLYATVPQAVLEDEQLYSLLALTDAIRVGRAREKSIAINELKSRIC